MNLVAWLLAGVAVIGLLMAPMIYLGTVMAWEAGRTRGLGYYGLSSHEREAFKKTLKLHATVLSPVLGLLGRLRKVPLDDTSFSYRGIAGPKGTCSEESFASGATYEATGDDVFVVTQMKSGTTWMQHVVFQVLTRGQGDLVGEDTTLYAVSPWLESLKSVPVGAAPLIGRERPSRIIKTHFPRELCPWSPDSLYIYVVRNPAACFASCADFIGENLGPFAPDLAEVERWFCSPESMWWGPWPRHVADWYQQRQGAGNVLWVRFEDMKANLSGVVSQVADFLGLEPLTEDERLEVTRKCSFGYMRAAAATFEMHPPHLLAVNAKLFVKGTADRHLDVPPDVRDRVLGWCDEELSTLGYRLGDFYEDAARGH